MIIDDLMAVAKSAVVKKSNLSLERWDTSQKKIFIGFSFQFILIGAFSCELHSVKNRRKHRNSVSFPVFL